MILGWSDPGSAFAYIPHWDPQEGFFIRQFSYLFFLFAMLFFFYELKAENLSQNQAFASWPWPAGCSLYGTWIALWGNSSP